MPYPSRAKGFLAEAVESNHPQSETDASVVFSSSIHSPSESEPAGLGRSSEMRRPVRVVMGQDEEDFEDVEEEETRETEETKEAKDDDEALFVVLIFCT